MDVLPFSLSCDHCAFRTKSMSAMRQHASGHQMAADVQRGEDISGGLSVTYSFFTFIQRQIKLHTSVATVHTHLHTS